MQLDLDQLKPLQQGDDWKSLVLPTGHREMVQAMVETHTRGSRESVWEKQNAKGKVQMDLVQGKGEHCDNLGLSHVVANMLTKTKARVV